MHTIARWGRRLSLRRVSLAPPGDADDTPGTSAVASSVGFDLQQMLTGVAEIDRLTWPARPMRHAWTLHIADGPWPIPIGNPSVFDALKDRLKLVALHGESKVSALDLLLSTKIQGERVVHVDDGEMFYSAAVTQTQDRGVKPHGSVLVLYRDDGVVEYDTHTPPPGERDYLALPTLYPYDSMMNRTVQ